MVYIEVSNKEEPGQIILVVSDKGIGLKELYEESDFIYNDREHDTAVDLSIQIKGNKYYCLLWYFLCLDFRQKQQPLLFGKVAAKDKFQQPAWTFVV